MVDNGDVLYLGKFDHDLTSRPSPGIMVNKRNHPQMVHCFHLYLYIYILPFSKLTETLPENVFGRLVSTTNWSFSGSNC